MVVSRIRAEVERAANVQSLRSRGATVGSNQGDGAAVKAEGGRRKGKGGGQRDSPVRGSPLVCYLLLIWLLLAAVGDGQCNSIDCDLFIHPAHTSIPHFLQDLAWAHTYPSGASLYDVPIFNALAEAARPRPLFLSASVLHMSGCLRDQGMVAPGRRHHYLH